MNQGEGDIKMAKNKVLVITSVVAAIAIICVFLATILFKPNTNELMRFSIYPSYTSYSSYYLVLYDDATLKCSFGERSIDDIQADKFMYKIRKSVKTKLHENEFMGLIILADELIASGFSRSGFSCDDWYYVTLLYYGTAYTEVYKHYQSDALEKLSEELIKLSPLKIELEFLGEE